MELSIIIVNYNTCSLLLKCLKSIFESLKNIKLDYEIIIVDNGSEEKIKDQTLRFGGQISNLKTLNEKIRIIKNKNNLGFGRANNQGAKIANGKYLLFLNTDIEVLDQGVWKLYQFINNNSDVSVAGGKLFNKNKTKQSSCGPFFSLPVVFASLFFKGDKIGLTRYSPVKVQQIDWVSGACFIIRKKDFSALLGFDENIFMYMEEVDLFYRAKQKNLNVYFYPGAEFIHLGAAASKKLTDPILNIYKGLLYFYKKHKSEIEIKILELMLKTKALISYKIGKILKNSYLVETYEKAYKLVNHV